MVIYKTTNLINGKYYIGKDHANNPEYLGSGYLLKKAISKYGRENFKKEILFYCKDLKDLAKTEKEIVTESICKDPSSYNLAIGGHGGNTHAGWDDYRRDEFKKLQSEIKSRENNPMYGKMQTEEGRKRISESNKKSEHPNNNREREKNPFHGKTHSDENKKRWSDSRSGSKNPRARRCIAGGIEYGSTKDASIALGIHPSTIRQRINSDKWVDFYYLSDI